MKKTLYIECNMGAAGDMLTAALYELLSEEEKQEFLHIMNHHGVSGVQVVPEASEKCGIKGTHMSVLIRGKEEVAAEDIAEARTHESAHNHNHNHTEHSHNDDHEHHHDYDHDHEHDHHHEHHHDQEHHHHGAGHHHASYHDVCEIIDCCDISDWVKTKAKAVYSRIAEAESHAHGKPVTEIHFHEVGMYDAITDVVNVCWIIEKLNLDKIIVSPINVGYGQVKCAHGILPVPAPATAFLLKDAPIYQGLIRGEMCTPTGAALLQEFKTEYSTMPVMKIEKIGYGMGKKDFEQANCVRVYIGEEASVNKKIDKIIELSCNLDDMTGEEISYATEILRENGALDVYVESIQMKKDRPGQMLVCMCKPEDADKMATILLKNTTSWGVRKQEFERYVLDRASRVVETPYGSVRVKEGSGYGVSKFKLEYEDIKKVAAENGFTIKEVENIVISQLLHERECAY